MIDIEDEVDNTPIIKMKETNKYKLKMKWYDLVKFEKMEKTNWKNYNRKTFTFLC